MTNQPQGDRIPIAHSVVYAVRGLPEIADEYYATRTIAPTEITLTYRSAPDSQLGRVHAYVKGWWMEGGERVPTDKPVGRHLYGGPEAWPAWLAEEARLHDPDAVSGGQPGRADDRAAALREAADELWALANRLTERGQGVLWAAERLRRLAAETQQPEPAVAPREWCKCRSCWGWFVEEHPGEDLDELGRDLGWWSGLPEHRDAPAGARQQPDTERALAVVQRVRESLASLRDRGADGPAYYDRILSDLNGEQRADTETQRCTCPHPADEHSVYGCADGCGCEWMPGRKPVEHAPGTAVLCPDCRAKGYSVCMTDEQQPAAADTGEETTRA